MAPCSKKRRAHFHEFMADVHNRIAAHRQRLKNGETKQADPVPPVAAALYAEAELLCFDEFTVTDIADAMILSRLFSELFALGCVLIATSNVEPDNLYRDGLNRGLFLPFIELLKKNVEVVTLEFADRLPHGEAEQPAGLPDADRRADGYGHGRIVDAGAARAQGPAARVTDEGQVGPCAARGRSHGALCLRRSV